MRTTRDRTRRGAFYLNQSHGDVRIFSGVNMNDMRMSATVASAVLLWVIGGTLALLELVSDIDSGAAGVTIATGAAVLNVRAYFCRFETKARNAFELGRDFESSKVRTIM